MGIYTLFISLDANLTGIEPLSGFIVDHNEVNRAVG